MRARALLTLLTVVALTVALVSFADASGNPSNGGRFVSSRAAHQASAVSTATVTQSAQSIVWSVTMQSPFDLTAMRKAGRSLCLVLEHLRTGAAFGDLCAIGPAKNGRSPRLVFEPISHGLTGHAQVVSATISRASSRELTASFQPSAYGASGYASFSWQVRTSLRGRACTAGSTPGGETRCVALYPARARIAALHTPQLVGCVPTGPTYVTNGPTDVHDIALTFDDGPWYDTSQFLDILEHYKVPATFFEIGDQVSEYGEGGAIERRMLADGDMIGDHTWNHHDVAAGGSYAAGEIEQAAAAIKAATDGFEPCLFRAPYGDVSNALTSEARSLGFTTIQWNDDPRDWSRPGVDAIYDTVISEAHNGGIIIQHDGGGDRSETIAALPREIATLEHEGYRFVTVTQMLGYKLLYR